ncbi:hypothetical protein LWI28_010014 [Acer negundo]|uniref:Uncharacterized protein n=1 Tax=Acer negundo TaxID=4023 RepID=A0AAD5JH61_ACENE|nr:hypothetical protein LWI28_010014 [Acer negundo]
MGFVNGIRPCPHETITTGDTTTPNPAHHIWVRQDQLLLNAILGSISPSIIPSCDAWTALANIYAKPSRGHIMHLKGVLTNINKENPEDLTVKILIGMSDEFRDISSAVRARDSPISFEELHEKL